MPDNLSFSLIFYVLFFVILGFSMLVGLIKGFKKSVYSFIVMLIFYAVFFLTLNWVVNLLWTTSIPGLGAGLSQISPQLQDASSLKEALPIMMDMYLGETLDTTLLNEEFFEFATSISLFVVKIVYTILYFTVFNLIYRFIFAIIGMIFVRYHKDEDEPRHRGLGALFGLLRGAVFLYFVLIFLGGIVNIAENSQKLLPEEYRVTEVDQVVTGYNENLVVKVVDQVAVKDGDQVLALNLKLFDSIFSIDYRDNKISIRNELEIGADINEIYLQSDFKQSNNVSDITGEEVRSAFTVLSRSDLFNVVIPLGVEVGYDYIEADITIPKEQLYEIDWSTEIMQLGEVAAVAFDLINSAGLMNDDVDYDTVTINGEHVRELFSSLSESELVTLAAYEALQPLLTEAGANVEAIITVPDDLVWEDEFVAIGEVAGEIVDTGITVGDLKSGDPSVLISSLANLDFTVMLDSTIISHALINIISGEGSFEDFDVFVVPDDILNDETLWFDEIDNDGNITQNGELRNILLAVNELSQTVGNVDFANIDMNILADFTDDSVNALFNSRVLVATVSTVIADVDLGNTPLLIVDSVYDENDYIEKEELTALVNSARMVVTTLACEEGDSCENGFDVSKAFNLSDDDINTLLASEVISATVGNLILDQGGEVITVPATALTSVTVDEVAQDVVSSDEIKNMFKAVSVFGFTDLENMNFDASIIHNLGTTEDVTVLDEDKANNLFASEIVHATLSTMLLDLIGTAGDEESQVLVVPKYDVDEDPIQFQKPGDNVTWYISDTELKGVLRSVLALDIADFNNIETLDINNVNENIDTLLNSAILHATISKQLIDLGEDFDIVIIPHVHVSDDLSVETDIIIPILEDAENQYINKTEIEYLVNALVELEININSFEGSISPAKLYDETVRDALLDSAILQATVSKQIFDLDTDTNEVLVIPQFDANNVEILVSAGVGEEETTYIKVSEIDFLIEAIEQLIPAEDIENISDFNVSMSPAKLYDGDVRTILLNSTIVHATISKQLFDLDTAGNEILEIPYIAADNVTEVIKTSGTGEEEVNFLSVDEINYFMEAVELLIPQEELDDITNFDLDLSPSKLYDNTLRDSLLDSHIIHATMSKQLLDLNTSGTLVIPELDVDNQPIRFTVGAAEEATNYLDEDEIHHLIEAIEIIVPEEQLDDITNFDGIINLDALKDNEENQNDLLLSASIHATVSDKLFNLDTSDILIIPNDTQEGIEVVIGNYIDKDEIKHLIDAFNELGIDLETDVTIDSTQFFPDDATLEEEKEEYRETMLASSLIQATLSEKLLTESGGNLMVPDAYTNGDPIRIADSSGAIYIDRTELNNMLIALDELNLTEFGSPSFVFNPSSLFNNYDFNTLLASASIQATISDNILDFALDETEYTSNDLTLIVPTYFREDISINSGLSKQIIKTELFSLLTSLELLGISDFNEDMNTTTITTMSEANLTTMLDSGSIHVTFDNLLQRNANINTKIPDLAKDNYYNMLNKITKDEELVDFIMAAKTLSGDFTQVEFNLTLVYGLTVEDEDIVLTSMIVRNILTEQLLVVINSDPLYSVDYTFYEDKDNDGFGDTDTFFTKPKIKEVLDHYRGII